MIIGLTGRNGSGKGSVAEILKEKGFQFYSLSDEIREALREDGHEITRENLIKKGRELREEYGSSVLAERVLDRVQKDVNAIVDSIRNPEEAKALKKRPDFALVDVQADAEVRFERCLSRGREKDPQSFEEFQKLESAELQSDNPAAQQLIQTAKLSDYVLDNSGTLEDLKDKIEDLLKTISS